MYDWELKECNARIVLEIPKESLKDLFKIVKTLNDLGITFKLGGYRVESKKTIYFGLEIDKEARGIKVYHREFKDLKIQNLLRGQKNVRVL